MARNILFICTGNICRSPMAEGMMRSLLTDAGLSQSVFVASAGTHAREGSPPERTAIELAAERGIDISTLRARQFLLADFERHDLILAMDRGNLGHLRFLCPAGYEHKVQMLMRYAPDGLERDVVDPYGRRRRLFEQALADIESGCTGLLAQLRQELTTSKKGTTGISR